jgi:peptide-methionine (R)-S-oxide reductase
MFEITKTPAEWQRILTPAQYAVLREHQTEPRQSSPLNTEHRKGVFACAGCQLPLFDSSTKYESGTGWPSFTNPLPNAVGTQADNTWLMSRTEVHCRRCGGHLGHVFEDGPPPLGTRYCMNGIAMVFLPNQP